VTDVPFAFRPNTALEIEIALMRLRVVEPDATILSAVEARYRQVIAGEVPSAMRPPPDVGWIRMEDGPISRLPRWVHHAYALVAGYFWLPCPLCDRLFGGHEARDIDGLSSSTPAREPGRPDRAICPACTRAGCGTKELRRPREVP
jgi:hypothetical protein